MGNQTKSQPYASTQELPEVEINPQVVQLGPAILARVLDKYLETQPQLLDDMRRHLDSGAMAGLRDSAHSLKGSAATLGLETMSTLCRNLETSARDGDSTAAGQQLKDVLMEGKRLEGALRAYLEELK